jgi:prefoldin subunit 5
MTENLLIADMRSCIKETFGDLITSMDGAIPRLEAAERKYAEAKDTLRSQIKRLYAGLEKLDAADTPERIQKIEDKMVQIATEDVAETFGAFIKTFVEVVKEYIK